MPNHNIQQEAEEAKFRSAKVLPKVKKQNNKSNEKKISDLYQ